MKIILNFMGQKCFLVNFFFIRITKLIHPKGRLKTKVIHPKGWLETKLRKFQKKKETKLRKKLKVV